MAATFLAETIDCKTKRAALVQREVSDCDAGDLLEAQQFGGFEAGRSVNHHVISIYKDRDAKAKRGDGGGDFLNVDGVLFAQRAPRRLQCGDVTVRIGAGSLRRGRAGLAAIARAER